jgi:tRNA(Arg) A34 adenosine deaminase TadA
VTAPARFRQADLTRALKAAKAAGIDVGQVVLEPSGKIVIMPAGRTEGESEPNPWDEDEE